MGITQRIGLGLFALSLRAPACDAPPAPGFHRIAIISDLNSEYGSETYEPRIPRAVRRVIASRPAFVLSTGDMVAGQWKNLGREKLRAMWAAFHRTISEPLYAAGLPIAVTPGNHDASPSFADDQLVFHESWTEARGKGREQPSKYFRRDARLRGLDLSHYPFRYSFTYGGALFVGLDATGIGVLPAGQKMWIRDQLRRYAELSPKILFGHVPFQPVTTKKMKEALFDPDFERELRSLGASVYISGHHHAYYPGRLASQLLQLSVGALGQGQRTLIGRDENSPASFLLLDWNELTGALRWRSCIGDDFGQTEDEANLPVAIDWAVGSKSGRILRSDLAP